MQVIKKVNKSTVEAVSILSLDTLDKNGIYSASIEVKLTNLATGKTTKSLFLDTLYFDNFKTLKEDIEFGCEYVIDARVQNSTFNTGASSEEVEALSQLVAHVEKELKFAY